VPDIRIRREHQLGLAQARKVAAQWAEDVESKFDMQCSVVEGKTSDTVQFKRSGVNGTLVVAADHFDLDAKLGLLLGVFAKTIETEILKELDTLLSAAKAKPAAKAVAKKAAAKAKK
jgi:putative polyhydroxyalkanoate system protein